MEKTLRRVSVGMTLDFPQKLGKSVIIGTEKIAVFKLANGDIYAIENRCPHKGGVLAEGMVSGEYVFSPMHDWKISIIDGIVQAPDEGSVKTFPVEVHDENVFILVNE